MTQRKAITLFSIFILFFLLIVYRQAIFGGKIVFPSNYLASFYSPWSTEKFLGWEQGIPHKPIGADQLRFFYPSRSFGFHLWNPYVFSGNPFLANFQSALFYPLNSPYYLLPQITAWSILVFIQPLLATVFCYLFLSCFPVKKIAAAFGAFAFGFSGFVITWSQEAMAVGQSAIWLPLILYGLEKKKFWLATVALTFSILAGYLQTTIYIFAFVFFYALYRKIEIKKIFLLFALVASLSAIQIVPSLEAFSLSARPSSTIEKVFDTYLLPVTHLIKTVAPDINGNPGTYNYFGQGSYNETVLYTGVVPLIFALYAFKKRSGPVKFFLIATVTSFLLTSNFFLTRWFLHLPLPLIPSFQPSRILILTTFSLAVLSAFGLSSWLEKPDKKSILTICVSLTAILLLTLGYYRLILWQPQWLVAIKNSFLPLAILLMLTIFLPFRRLSLLTILTLTVVSQAYFFNKYLVLGDEQFLYPKNTVFERAKKEGNSFDRFVAFNQPVLGNFVLQERVYSPEGYDPIFSKRYGQLIYAGRDFADGKISSDLPRIEVTLSQVTMDRQRLSRLLSLLAVKNTFYFDGGWQFKENQGALPRAFLAGSYVVEKNAQKILDKIFDPNFNLRKTVILEETLDKPPVSGSGAAKIISYEPEKVAVETNSLTNQVLFLSDNFYPGWKAEVDGRESKIYRADFSFRAVAVPAGKHLVTFNYEPLSFEIGKGITLAVLLLLCLQIFRRGFPFEGFRE